VVDLGEIRGMSSMASFLFAYRCSLARRLVVRYERRVKNYLGLVRLGCIVILLRHL
jgi:hypothetical protein